MEAALVGCGVTEVADGEPVLASVVRGERRPSGEGNLSPDNAVPAQAVVLDVEDVHRAALALAVARAPAEQLGHHHAHVCAAGERVAVVAVRGD